MEVRDRMLGQGTAAAWPCLDRRIPTRMEEKRARVTRITSWPSRV